MKTGYIIGIDSGTSMVKAALFDMQGNEICVASRSTPVEEPYFGWSEFDMDVDWKEVASVISDLMGKCGVDKKEVLAIGLGGKGVGVCFLDKDNRPARKGILWNDARCAGMTREWIESGKMEQIFGATANWLMTGDVGILLPWMKAHEPEVLERTAHFCLNTNWMCYNLTGEFGSNATDFYSQIDETRTYSDKVMEIEGILDLKDKFLPLQEPWEICGHVTEKAAQQTGLAAGTPVASIGWDVVCCSAGVGAVDDGQANIILGTSGVIMLTMPKFAHSPMLGCQTIHNIPGKWQQLIAPLTGTPNSDWFVNNFTCADKLQAEKEGRSVYALFDEVIDKVNPGCDGAIYHPYMNAAGERAPFTNTNARGNFFGLNLHSDRHVMQRAVYEGMAFANKHCLDAYTYPVSDIRLSGGGSKSPVWCQIFADICNAPISLPGGTEFGAKGVAWNAALAAGYFGSWQEASEAFCKVERVYEPIAENVSIYADLYEVYKAIPYALFPAWEARTEFLKKHGFQG
ncbi:FGGY-family carbohydrate kinase [Eubacterium maltosivorans]|uniref:Carbohydrate kinase n=1 Tax=Eubacterium maltosivorans TaxID=2041044 RepID=A0A4P9CD90_EUBML|nr:FGGY-family carbohydrate kinase [Eubacterium maltosivorans]QCT72652.1 carbohydrate kinase [Eubacterium maltosivorans]